MYVKLLFDSLKDWTDELTKKALIAHALVCRREMLETIAGQRDTVYGLLGAEVAYDRALIKLCAVMRIECDVSSFAFPKEERRRVEAALLASGVDLAALSRAK